MTADADRLTRAELKLEQHDREHEETRSAIKAMATGIQKLAEAEVRREQDQETFSRIFGEIKALRADFEDYKDKQTEKELAAYRSIVWKVLGLAAVVMASVIAGHFGGKWLG